MAATDFGDGFTFTAMSTDVGPYSVLGGRYAVAVAATWGGGSATLRALMPDGTTYVTVLAPFTADGSALVNLPPGKVSLVIATATAATGLVVRVPDGRGA